MSSRHIIARTWVSGQLPRHVSSHHRSWSIYQSTPRRSILAGSPERPAAQGGSDRLEHFWAFSTGLHSECARDTWLWTISVIVMTFVSTFSKWHLLSLWQAVLKDIKKAFPFCDLILALNTPHVFFQSCLWLKSNNTAMLGYFKRFLRGLNKIF